MAKKKSKKQDWEIIDTPYGQWEYPGAITRIPSNDITMQGVPYPVLGVSDTNDIQMMYPNQDYQFDGSSVTEYPMMQTGGRPPLKILDPREFKIREQAYNDSLNLFLSSEKQKEALRSSGYSPLGNTPWSGGIASHPTIKPIQEEAWGKNGITSTWIDVYKKPVQPVVYEPRPNQTPIQLDRKEGLLESNPINLGDINLIPFEPGSYFTRERKPQEADRGKMEYFDKKTGRSIGLYDEGGELPEAGSGYKVVRSSERKGKTHKVTGPDGTVKFFGDSKLGQHPKDPARKKAFYARHKKNLAGNPYFRAFARKTWEEGGELDFAQEGLITLPKDKSQYSSDDSLKHQMAKTFMYEDKRGGAQGNHIPNFGYYNSTLPNFVPPTNLQEAVNYAMKEYAPKLIPYQTAMEKGEAFDFLYNTGKDPRAYSIQEYYRKYDPTKLDKEGKWSGRTGGDFDSLYKNTIAKLPENERRVLMNKGRDWYYQNINNPSPGVPSPAYKNTWYGRIWNTNDFSPFNPNNPKFTLKKEKEGGELNDWEILDTAQDGGSNWEILPEAQVGTQMGIISDPRKDAYYTQPANSNAAIQQRLEAKAIMDQRAREVDPRTLPVENKQSIVQANPQGAASKAWEIVSHPMTAITNLNKYGRIPDYFSAGSTNPLEYAFDVVNPVFYANAAGRTFKNIVNPQTYTDVPMAAASLVGNTILSGNQIPQEWDEALIRTAGRAGDAAVTSAALRPFVQKGLKYTGDINAINKELSTIRNEGISKGLSETEIRSLQMDKVGITDNQRKAFTPIVSDALAKYVKPISYEEGVISKLKAIPKNIQRGGWKNDPQLKEFQHLGKREDAWNLYLGKPQVNKTFRYAQTNPQAISYPELANNLDIYHLNYDKDLADFVTFMDNRGGRYEQLLKGKTIYPSEAGVMGGYNLTRTDANIGKSGLGEVEYNDIWDLHPETTVRSFFPERLAKNQWLNDKFFYKTSPEGMSSPRQIKLKMEDFIGKPFMSHGRVPVEFPELVDFHNSSSASSQNKTFLKKEGGSTWEIVSDNEWEVLNEKPSYQKGGKVVSEIWQDVTGTPWSEAKKLGLTKGGYEENLAIRAELLKNPEKFISLVKEYSGKTKTQPAVKQPVQQPVINKYNSFAARSFNQPYFEGDTYQEAAPSPNVQQPLPTYQWSNQQRVAPNLAAGDTPVATPRKAAPPKTQRVAITQRLPDLPLITNPIDSPYFQAPIESTKVVPQMIKKGKQDSSIIQNIVNTINKSEFLQDVKDTIGNVKDVEDVKNSLIRGLGKTGLYSPDTEEVEPMKVPTQKPIIQPIAKPTMNSSAVQDTTPTTYYQGKGIVDPRTGTNIGRYVNTFSNWKGQEYIPTKNVGEWKKDKTTQYPSSQIAHYLLDTDLTTGYQHDYSKKMIERQKKGESITEGSTLKEQWLPIYEKLPNGNVRIKYKINKELTKDDKIAAPLRQYKFGDLDWQSDVKSSWNKSSSALKTKTGKETNMIKSGKDMSGYGQFGGGSFVLISKRKNGEMIVRELAGSLQDLKNQAEDLAKMTGQDVNEVVVGYHDVGSWSAKPSSKNKKIGYTNIPKKNSQEFHSYQKDYTGAGLAFPFAYGGLTKSNWEIIK